MSPFDPIGDVARWRLAYDLIREAATDDVVTYDELGKALNLHPKRNRHAIQMAMRRAAQELEGTDKRAVDAVPNKGYRIMPAAEGLALARRHQKKAGRSLVRGHSKVANADMNEIQDPEVRKLFEATRQAFSLQMDFNRRFAVRQEKLEQAVREITETQSSDRQRSEDEVAKLRARIERLERERED